MSERLKEKILLGSQSPRRREILQFFSIPFQQVASNFDETLVPFTGDPRAFVTEIAHKKALALSHQYPSEIILTADTTVFLKNRVLNKPETMEEAYSMLKELSGTTHSVFTGVCVKGVNIEFIECEESIVEFCELTDDEIYTYANAINPLDKAGGYGIQSGGSLIVKRIEGCYYNIMGLPLQTVRRGLLKAGIDLWDYFKTI